MHSRQSSWKSCHPLFLSALLLPFLAIAGETLPPSKESKAVEPLPQEGWQFKLAVPSWVATVRGDVGINGSTSHSNTGFNEVVNKIDLAGSLRGEASFGRFGVLADFSYLSISDSVGVGGAVRKLDFRQDQILGDLGVRWRVLDTPHGWLDVLGGVRYTYLYEEIHLQSNDQALGVTADRLATAGTLLRLAIAQELLERAGRDPEFSIPPLGSGEAENLARAINSIRGNTAERAEKIEKVLKKALNKRLSRVDDWFDPYIGLRGRYNLNEKFYLTAKADVSPFDVGADFAWQAAGGFGYQLSGSLYAELVYRILDVEYRHDGLIYDTTTHGPELTVGLEF
jgi:opacity protein-like surface antigen